MTSKYLGLRLPKMQGMVAGNRSRENQDKDETMTSQMERMTSQIVSYVCYDGSSKHNAVGQASILQRHLGNNMINLVETFIFVGRIVHILWPKLP